MGKLLGQLVAASAIMGMIWWHGYEAGKSTERALFDAMATEVAQKAEQAAQRQAETLTDITETVKQADDQLEAIRKGLFDETAAPGACSIDAGWMLRLDKIR